MFLIASIVTLINDSGFWENLDRWVNEKWRFHHLPHILICTLCQTWWLCLLALVITSNVTLLNIVIALLFANTPEILSPLFRLIKGYILKIIECLGRWL